jgi:hypothetical protein
MVPVFLGGQFGGKTTWFNRLFEGLFPGSNECFVGGAEYTGDRDNLVLLTSCLVVEFGELDGTTSRAHTAKLKSFLSATEDHIRGLYMRDQDRLPRRTVFCGTVNDEAFLRDLSGNTRFGVVAVEEANLDAQRGIDKRQLWAQLATQCEEQLSRDLAVENGFARPWLFTREEISGIEVVNEQHRQHGDIESWLRDKYDWADETWRAQADLGQLGANPMTIAELVKRMAEDEVRGGTHRSAELTRLLVKLTGWKKSRLARVKVEIPIEGATPPQATFVVKEKRGRMWPMPPEIKFSRDLTAEEKDAYFKARAENSSPPS